MFNAHFFPHNIFAEMAVRSFSLFVGDGINKNAVTPGDGPPIPYPLVGNTTVNSFKNKNLLDPSNKVAATALLVNGTVITITGTTTNGDVLTKTANGLEFVAAAGGINNILLTNNDVETATVSGTSAMVIGRDSVVNGNFAQVFGFGSSVTGIESIIVGKTSTISGNNNIVMGSDHDVTSTGFCCLGWESLVTSPSLGVGVGQFLEVSASQCVNIGIFNIVSGSRGVALGYQSDALDSNAISIGNQNTSFTARSITIGDSNTASNGIAGNIAFGRNNTASGSDGTNPSMAFGTQCTASGAGAMVWGRGSVASGSQSAAFGIVTSATLANSLVMNFSRVVFGANDSGAGSSLGSYADDATAAANGVPLGGLYRRSGALYVREV